MVADVVKMRWRSRMGPETNMANTFIRKEDAQGEHDRPQDNGGGGWGNASSSRGTPWVAESHQKLEETRGDSPRGFQRE